MRSWRYHFNASMPAPKLFGHATFLLAEVDDLHVEAGRVERRSDVSLGGDAHEAAGMVEGGQCHRGRAVDGRRG
ncbi:MAG: hypothetical protein L0Z50_08180 [Verrucomicrobiales bacterium]|nr:hypothetical protein [Verrucomicrobiales bacterium]